MPCGVAGGLDRALAGYPAAMTDQDWQNPQTQDPSSGDAVADGRPTPGRPRETADLPPGSNGWREASGRQGDAESTEVQAQEVRASQLDQGTRADTELGT